MQREMKSLPDQDNQFLINENISCGPMKLFRKKKWRNDAAARMALGGAAPFDPPCKRVGVLSTTLIERCIDDMNRNEMC